MAGCPALGCPGVFGRESANVAQTDVRLDPYAQAQGSDQPFERTLIHLFSYRSQGIATQCSMH